MKKYIQPILAAALAAFAVFILLQHSGHATAVAAASDFARFIMVVAGVKLLFVAALAVGAFGVGGVAFRGRLPDFSSMLEEGVVRVALGLVIISYAVFLVGLAGFLHPVVGYALMVACLGVGARDTIDYVRRLGAVPMTVKLTVPLLLLTGVSAYFLIRGFRGSLLPPTAFDVLMYHVGVPRLYVEAHGIFPTPDINGSSYPFATEMLYMLGMLVESDVSANMVNFFMAVGCGLVGAMATRRFVKDGSPLLTATVFFSLPVVFWLMPQAYVEFAQGFYLSLAFYALWASLASDDPRWLTVSAVLTGMAMSIKLTSDPALFIMLAFVLYRGFAVRRDGAKAALLSAVKYALIAGAICAPWYLKNLAFYGNPLYPMLSSGGGSGDITQYYKSGMKTGLLDLLTLPWRLTMDPAEFRMGDLNSLGPVLLMFMPGVLLFRGALRELKYVLAFIVLFTLMWFFSAQNIRYLVPAAPLLALVAAYPAGRLLKGGDALAKVGGVAVVAIFCFAALYSNTAGSAVAGFPSRDAGSDDAYYSGLSNQQGYLASYDTWKRIDLNLPPDAVIYQLWDDASVNFRRRKVIGFPLGFGPTSRNRLTILNPDGSFGGFRPGEEIIANLKEMGAGYLLINANREGKSVPQDPYFAGHTRLLSNDKDVFLFQVVP